MPTILLSLGYPQQLVQNTVYAMPNKACYVVANAVLTFSNDGFATSTTVATNVTAVNAFAAVQCTTITNAIITCKPLV